MRKLALWAMPVAGLFFGAAIQNVPAQQAPKQTAKQTVVPDADWPMYSRDLTSARFSPLKQINTQNISQLKTAWTYRPAAPEAAGGGDAKGKGKGGGGGGLSPEVTPIVVNGVMYLPGGNRVFALEADTGKEIWSYRAPGAVGSRGAGYWPGDAQNPPRVLFITGTTMMALNARTGAVDPGFGKEGSVDIGIQWGGAPYVFRNLIVIGNNNGEANIGPPGDTKTYDARTGAKLWDFKSVAQPGDPNHATWLDDGWKGRSGVNTWGWYYTVDEERNILYQTFGSPAGNYWGGDRPGNNLYANSVVAVDATTGKYKWHYQLVHHDLWDTDLPAAPSLLNVTRNGRAIPALAVISKNALMFILNRETGEPIHGVEERPVPKGSVPGEWYSPTQPFPVKPAPLARMSFKGKEDMVTADDTTPEHAKACQELWDRAGGFWNEGPFTPFLFHEAGAPPKTSIQFPGNGGPNWGGTSADPTMGYVFVSTHDAALSGWIEKHVPGGNYGNLTEGSTLPYDRGSITGPGPYNGFAAAGMPCQKGPWGRLFAVNANTGDIAWEAVLGLNERLPAGKQLIGNVGSAGPTSTAGGLVFAPANDSRLHVFDSKTGKEVLTMKIDATINANIMTYQAKGKQYVAAVATNHVVAFAIP